MSVRIGKATGAFNQLNNVWKNKNISISNKVKIYVAAVSTILTYGCEVWSITQTTDGTFAFGNISSVLFEEDYIKSKMVPLS